MVAHARWMVSELTAPRDSLPRYVIAHRQGEAPWRCVWEHRDKLPGKLAAWFNALANDGIEPLARPLLGHGCALNERTAHAVCRFRCFQLGCMAGCSPGKWPDFLLNEKPVNCGKRGRPCAIVGPDGVKTFPSIASAAAAEGVTRPAVGRRVREGRKYAGGLVAL